MSSRSRQRVTVIQAVGRCFIGCMGLGRGWVRFPAWMLETASRSPKVTATNRHLWRDREMRFPVLKVMPQHVSASRKVVGLNPASSLRLTKSPLKTLSPFMLVNLHFTLLCHNVNFISCVQVAWTRDPNLKRKKSCVGE